MEFDTFYVFLFDVIDIFFVLAAKDDFFDPCSFGSEYLFSDSSHGENFSA